MHGGRSYCRLNGSVLLVPAEVVTLILRGYRAAYNVIRKFTVMVVEFTTVTLLTAIPVPSTVTVAGAVKFVPFSVALTVVPRVPTLGLSELRVGFTETGIFTVNV